MLSSCKKPPTIYGVIFQYKTCVNLCFFLYLIQLLQHFKMGIQKNPKPNKNQDDGDNEDDERTEELRLENEA